MSQHFIYTQLFHPRVYAMDHLANYINIMHLSVYDIIWPGMPHIDAVLCDHICLKIEREMKNLQ